MMKVAALAGVVFFSCQAFALSAQDEIRIGITNRKYPEVKAYLQRIVNENRGNAALFTLGANDARDEIIGVKIGSGAVKNLVVSTHHGNEYASAEMALAFAESVAKQPLAGQTMYVIPVLNIPGYNARQREERDSKGKSYDPNRNYPNPCGTEGPFTLKSIKLVSDFVVSEKIVAAATLHTYSPAVVYPWGMSTRDLETAYPDIFKKMVNDATVESHYAQGNSAEVIYPANGTFEDWAFHAHGIWSILFELGYSHSPGDRDMQTMIDTNVPGMRRMFENAPKQLGVNHAFKGKCDARLQSLDRHDE